MAATSNATASVAPLAVGAIVSYVEFTANVTVSATTDATANTVVTAATFVANGTDTFWIDFYAAGLWPGASAGSQVTCTLYQDGSGIGLLADSDTPAAAQMICPVFARKRIVPAAGPRTYSVRAYRTVSNGLVAAGAGGAATYPPGFICITKAAN